MLSWWLNKRLPDTSPLPHAPEKAGGSFLLHRVEGLAEREILPIQCPESRYQPDNYSGADSDPAPLNAPQTRSLLGLEEGPRGRDITQRSDHKRDQHRDLCLGLQDSSHRQRGPTDHSWEAQAFLPEWGWGGSHQVWNPGRSQGEEGNFSGCRLLPVRVWKGKGQSVHLCTAPAQSLSHSLLEALDPQLARVTSGGTNGSRMGTCSPTIPNPLRSPGGALSPSSSWSNRTQDPEKLLSCTKCGS